MSKWFATLSKQRRFKSLLVLILVMSFFLGLMVVPVESQSPLALIKTPFDGVWWSTTTITGVGFGDYYPVTTAGKIIGMILEVAGVLAFGLLVSMVTVALNDSKENFNRQRLIERLDAIDRRLDRLEKSEGFVIRHKEK